MRGRKLRNLVLILRAVPASTTLCQTPIHPITLHPRCTDVPHQKAGGKVDGIARVSAPLTNLRHKAMLMEMVWPCTMPH